MKEKNLKLLVSIIIPVYNAEKYIKNCVLSCINQTYKNIEILIINDGSTDKSIEIINELAKKDNRIKVFNKKNNGVSSARNDGINFSSGEYLCFLDADDYYSEEYIEYMLELIMSSKADFALSANCFKSSDDKQIEDNIMTISSDEATSLLLSSKVTVGCWNKIYKKSMLIENKIYFLEDLFYGEGLHFILNVAKNTNSICVGQKRVYYYRNNNLDSATTKFKYSNYVNGELSLMRIRELINNKDEKIIFEWNLHHCLFCINVIVRLINNKSIDNYNEKYDYWYKKVRLYKKTLVKDKKIPIKRKIYIMLACYFPRIIVHIDNYKKNKYIEKSV